MSAQSPRFTTTGRARTFADKHSYLKPQFWADPDNHFWESPHHTPASKAYFRANLEKMFSNIHNLVKVHNSQG